jgi:hypothetical protein
MYPSKCGVENFILLLYISQKKEIKHMILLVLYALEEPLFTFREKLYGFFLKEILREFFFQKPL